MHQIGFDCEELDRDSKAVMKTKLSLKRSNQQRRIKVAKAAKKSILDHFPNMPDIATEFIKANGFKAQEKRRDTTISSCGVLEKTSRRTSVKPFLVFVNWEYLIQQ